MSGRKVFTAGEVLQAADVNDFLMDQSVMVFAGTAARGSAIPSPTEGMVTYLQDADELQVYTTAWGAVGPGKILQVLTDESTTAVSIATTSTFTASGLSVSITPSSSSNKILIVTNHNFGNTSAATDLSGEMRILRDSTVLETWANAVEYAALSNMRMLENHSVAILDSPATTSSITYSTEIARTTGATLVVNPNSTNASKITVMEVAG